MIIRRHKNREDGFTLIELAISMIIIGLLVSALFAALKTQQQRQIIEDQQERFDNVISGLRDFVNDPQQYYSVDGNFSASGSGIEDDCDNPGVGGCPGSQDTNDTELQGMRFPCPANPNLDINNANFGREALNPALSPDGDNNDNNPATGANRMDVSTALAHSCDTTNLVQLDGPDGTADTRDDILIGTLPVKLLGIGNKDLDAYNQQYTYAITAGATLWDNAFSAPQSINDVAPGGGQRTFAIISHGETGAGAYLETGNRLACPAGSRDSENCDDDADFFLAGASQKASAAGANFYDDLAAGALTGSVGNDENWWDINGNNHIFNINGPGGEQGHVGIGTGPDEANNIQDGKFVIHHDPDDNGEDIPHMLFQGDSSEAEREGYITIDTGDRGTSELGIYMDLDGEGDNPGALNGNWDAADAGFGEDAFMVLRSSDTGVAGASGDGEDRFIFWGDGQAYLQGPVGIGLPSGNAQVNPKVPDEHHGRQLDLVVNRTARIGQVTDGAHSTDDGQSVAQAASAQNDRGYLQTPWVYTYGIQNADETAGGGTGITIGESASANGTLTDGDTVGLYTRGMFNLFIDSNVDGSAELTDAEISGLYITRDWDADTADLDPARVGLGTTTPQESFEIAAQSNPAISLHDRTTATYKIGIDEVDQVFKIAAMDNGFGGNTGDLLANDTQILSMDMEGRVGIGNNNPYDDLDIAEGSIRLSNRSNTEANHFTASDPGNDDFRIFMQDDQNNGNPYGTGRNQAIIFENLDGNNTDPDDNVYFINRGSDNLVEYALTIEGDGDIGLGRPSASERLHIGHNASKGGALRFDGPGTTTPDLYRAPGGDYFRIFTQNDSTHGSYGISDNAALIIENHDGNNADPDDQIYFVNTGSGGAPEIAMTIHGNNRVGMGVTNPGARLHVVDPNTADAAPGILTNGEIQASVYTYTSDSRLKTDLSAAPGIETVARLSPYSFRWNDLSGFEDQTQLQYGLMAQDLREIPELAGLVRGTQGDIEAGETLRVDYLSLVPVLIQATKDLKAENEELAAKNAEYGQKLAAIEKRLARVESANGLIPPVKSGFPVWLQGFALILVFMAGLGFSGAFRGVWAREKL